MSSYAVRNMEDLNKRIETEGSEHLRLDSSPGSQHGDLWRSQIHGPMMSNALYAQCTH